MDPVEKMDWLSGRIQALPELDKEKLGAAEVRFELARAWGRMMHLQGILLEWSRMAEGEFGGNRFNAKKVEQ